MQIDDDVRESRFEIFAPFDGIAHDALVSFVELFGRDFVIAPFDNFTAADDGGEVGRFGESGRRMQIDKFRGGSDLKRAVW